jgi:DNA replication protein DnaC
MDKSEMIKDYCRRFKLSAMAAASDEELQKAQAGQISYTDYLLSLLETEARHREEKSLERRYKTARLPLKHNLDTYDHTVENGMNKTRLNQLRELNWLDQIFNIVLMGPSGTGKTFMAAGLCFDAVKAGYSAMFRTMDDIVSVLKMKDITRTASAEYKRMLKASLIIIDDIMLFPLEKQDAVSFFNFINLLFEKTAFIITTNKSPKEWAQMLNDQVLATALLDRLLYRCEVINLKGKSYRLENRKTIFNNE